MSREEGLLPLRLTGMRVMCPDTLLGICAKYFVENLTLFCAPPAPFDPNQSIDVNFFDPLPVLRDGLRLPSGICDKLLESYQINVGQVDDRFAHIFRDTTTTNLTTVRIRHSSISDQGLLDLLRHKLCVLTIERCKELTHHTFVNLLEHAGDLRQLIIGSPVDMCPTFALSSVRQLSMQIKDAAPRLKRLDLMGMRVFVDDEEVPSNNSPEDDVPHLSVLNLSDCFEVSSLNQLWAFSHLHSLILYNVFYSTECDLIGNICSLTSLVVLDMSVGEYGQVYTFNDRALARIVTCLPNLEYLDISGTNLAGTGTERRSSMSSSGPITDIPGLISRLDNPLEFLGLFQTAHNACRRLNIPAKRISGDANEIQILNAAASSMNKPFYLLRILNYILRMLQRGDCTMIGQVIDTLIEILIRHNDSRRVIIEGVHVLLFIVDRRYQFSILDDITVKQRIISMLISVLNGPVCDADIIYLVFHTINRYGVLQEMWHEFNRFVKTLLYFTSFHEHPNIQNFGINFISGISKHKKIELGDAGVIKKMLKLIKNRMIRKLDDYVLNVSWLIIWNITHEAPVNCQRFLDESGMSCFLGSLAVFPFKNNLQHCMLGSIKNIVEIKILRSKLMQSYYVQVFYDVMLSSEYDVGVCFNAVAIIAYLASEGPTAWTIETPSRHEVLNSLANTLDNWNIDENIRFYYHSVKSILELAQVKHTIQCVFWAVWTLAYITKNYPLKYCSIVIAEGSLQIMRELLEEHSTHILDSLPRRICNLAQKVINQCYKFLEDNEVNGDP